MPERVYSICSVASCSKRERGWRAAGGAGGPHTGSEAEAWCGCN